MKESEKAFNEEIDELYEDVIADKIFKENATLISKEEFAKAIAG